MFSNKKTLTKAICFVFAFILLASIAFIDVESDHDCAGTDCPICIAIEAAIQHIDITAILIAASICILAALRKMSVAILIFKYFVTSSTLVSLKVKLSN